MAAMGVGSLFGMMFAGMVRIDGMDRSTVISDGASAKVSQILKVWPSWPDVYSAGDAGLVTQHAAAERWWKRFSSQLRWSRVAGRYVVGPAAAKGR